MSMQWAPFIAKHLEPGLLAAIVSDRLPIASLPDLNGRRLPTPYGLFREWVQSLELNGDWSSRGVKGLGFMVGFADRRDEALVLARYPAARKRGFTIDNVSVPIMNFSDGSYAALAELMGYSVNYSTRPSGR